MLNRQVLGVDRTVVVTYNANLFVGQVQGLTMHLNKAMEFLKDFQKRLLAQDTKRAGKRITQSSVEKQVKAALSAQFLPEVVRYGISGDKESPQLTFSIDRAALRQLEDR